MVFILRSRDVYYIEAIWNYLPPAEISLLLVIFYFDIGWLSLHSENPSAYIYIYFSLREAIGQLSIRQTTTQSPW